MNKYLWIGCGLLVACVAVGCARSDDDVVKDQIAVMNEAAAEYDKVTDEKSAEAAKPKFEALSKRANDNAKIIDAWPKEKKDQMKTKYEADMKAAGEKLGNSIM